MALYHSSKGPVGYTVVGSPTIVDGVVSGFSGSNYLTTTDIPFSTANTWQIRVAFTCFGSADDWQDPIENSFTSQGFQIQVNSAGTKAYVALIGTSGTSLLSFNNEISVNQKYYYDLEFTGTQYIVKRSTDKQTWETLGTEATSEKIAQPVGKYLVLGNSQRYSYARPFNGSIDLNETYIKVNGQPWFGLCPVEVQKHQLKGPVGYTVVGSPTIVDGVASGFSSSDYVQATSVLPDNIDTFELCIKYDNMAADNRLFRLGTSSDTAYNLRALSNKNIAWYGDDIIFISDKHVDDYTYVKVNTTNGLNSNVQIQVSNDGNSWETATITTAAGNTTVRNDTPIFGRPVSGSIDLNHTYIKVNGKLWFYQPADTKYIVKDGKLVWADQRIYIDDNGTKTYATQHIAPVPAGYTYGTTTTPSIGYVDMRTQQFTAAPSGATIGRDE